MYLVTESSKKVKKKALPVAFPLNVAHNFKVEWENLSH